MQFTRAITAIFLLLISCGTKTGDTETQRLREEIFSLRQQNDSLKRLVDQSSKDTSVRDTIRPVEHSTSNSNYPKFPGKHALTLQWISWDFPGSVLISQADDGWYTIKGSQTDRKNPENYLRISGRIKPITMRELLFEGTIESRIDHLNDGKACVRNGQQTFKAAGTRKYWRLQQMTNCEGGTVDYIDIYF